MATRLARGREAARCRFFALTERANIRSPVESSKKQVVPGVGDLLRGPRQWQTPPFETGCPGLEESRVLYGLAKNLFPYVVKGAAIITG